MAFYYSMVVFMKFQDSKFEMRYNELWNQYAVSTDNLIKSKSGSKRSGLFVLDESHYVDLISKYAFVANNIVSNLTRQTAAGMYDDKDYIEEYLKSTIDNTFADFDQYRSLLGSRYGEHSKAVALINETLQTLGNLFSEYKASSYPSSKLEDDYPASCSY